MTKRKKQSSKALLKSKWTALLIILLLTIGLITYFLVFYSPISVYEAIPYTAVLVDQLALTHPNPTFAQTVNNTLFQAGFTLDYFNYSQVTVDFYKQLPSKRYSLIILRVHSGVGEYSGLTSLYTSENYSEWAHYTEQINKQVVAVEYVPDGPKYFAITSSFVKTFDICKNSIVIMMGCKGLNKTDLGEALVQKGVRAYISWNGEVSPGHTDKAVSQLVKNIVSNQTIAEAVNNVMSTVGVDPIYNSHLTYYPSEAGNYFYGETSKLFENNIFMNSFSVNAIMVRVIMRKLRFQFTLGYAN